MKPSYRFDPFVLDGRAYRLMRGETPLELPPKVLDLLFLLAAKPGALLTKEDIFDALWPGVSVTDNAITQVVSDLRQALGDTPASPAFVQTVPRRGYRFIAGVTVVDNGAHDPGAAPVDRDATIPSAPSTRAAGTAGPKPRAIAVMEFTNLSGDESLNWLAAGIAETMTHDLRGVKDLAVIDRVTAAQAERLGAGGAPTPDLLVVGSVQRAGDRLRITARVVDSATRQALTHARADGPVAEIFDLQDALVTQLSAGLQLSVSPDAAARIHARDTSSLDAYRALTEGRLKLEALDPAAVPGATADFERALQHDPRYALAHVGLAHACFWKYQASRASASPEVAELGKAVAHARRAVELESDLAEAHSSLALFLASSDKPAEAVAAGRLAVAIEPGNWRHQFRYGMAAWGSERLDALDRVAVLFPPLGFSYFGSAMVHIARGDVAGAGRALDAGVAFEDADGQVARLPPNGLRWLRGLLCLAAGDVEAARAEFDRELALARRGLFAQEYAMDAWVGHAYARLQQDALDEAATMFELALGRFPNHARSWLGLADVRFRQGRRADTEAALSRGLDATDALRDQGRLNEAALASATAELLAGRPDGATAVLSAFVAGAPLGPAGWTLAIEPAFASIRALPAFKAVLAEVAERAG
jgi:DNA-binding winged helix-turn-helix (wHTH) protein/tetratricopeptide (TPR) repeat protein